MKKFITAVLLTFVLHLQVYSEVVPQGTLVVVQPQKIIDADDVKQGDTVKFNIIQPVKVNKEVVFKTGIEVSGKVTKKRNNGILGIPGEITISEFQIITQNNDIIRLTGTISDKGDNRYWANIGWFFVFPLLFIKGNDGKIFPNTTHMLYTAEDYSL